MKVRTKLLKLREENKREAIELGLEPLICRACNLESYVSLIGHINFKHGGTKKYRELYGDHQIQRMLKSKKIKASIRMKQNVDQIKEFVENGRSFPSEIKHWTRKGFSEEEAKKLISEHQTKLGLRQKLNPECIEYKRQISSGDKNPMSLKSISERHGISIEEASKITPCYGRTGEKHPMFNKQHSDESVAKIANSKNLKNPTWRSKVEIKIAEYCDTLGLCEKNIPKGRWNVDVVFEDKKLIIDYFGTVWHMCPKKYGPNDWTPASRKRQQAKDVWARDDRRKMQLENLGYRLITIWESEWNQNSVECLKRIKDAFDQVE